MGDRYSYLVEYLPPDSHDLLKVHRYSTAGWTQLSTNSHPRLRTRRSTVKHNEETEDWKVLNMVGNLTNK